MLNEEKQLVVLISYGLLCEHESFLEQFKWNIHVYDEAHNLKNIKTKRTTVARKFSAQFKLCLSGTPLENHYDELYSQLDLVVPGCLGKHSDFLTRFVRPTEVNNDDLQLLKLKMKPLLLRRSKTKILKELPEKTESLLKIPFEDSQKKIYRNIAVSWNEKIMKV